MSTHDAGTGNERLNLAVPKEMKTQLRRLAKQSGLSMSAYIKKVLKDALDSGVTFQLTANATEPQADYNATKHESEFIEAPQANDENGKTA